MKKGLYIGLTFLTGLMIGLTGLTTANASAWHKGTPKAIRGSWVYHRKQVSQWGNIKFFAKRYSRIDQGMPETFAKKLTYQSRGHGVYKIRGYFYALKGTGYHPHWETLTVSKHKGKIKIHNYSGWLHRGKL